MITITNQAEFMKTILHEQKVCSNQKYRLIKYCLQVPVENGLLLHNLLTKEIVLLDTAAKTLSEADIENCADKDELIRRRFLVPVDFDEKQFFNQFKELLMLTTRDKTKPVYTILTTTACNARCFYCYEMGRRTVTMSKETALAAAQFIKNTCGEQEVKLSWFGGEPLVNTMVIDVICDYLHENGVALKSVMTSNGYLFQEDLIRKAKEKWNLKSVQISLDGTRDLYNSSKSYKNNDPNAFETVMKNIDLLLKNDIIVHIRLNMGGHNKDDLFALCNELSDRFGHYKNIIVYAAQLYENEKIPLTEELLAEKVTLQKEFIRLQDHIRTLGIGKTGSYKPLFQTQHCMVNNDRSAVILPDGKLSKCQHFSDSEFVGDVYHGITDHALAKEWGEYLPEQPECGDCAVYPVCMRPKKCPYESVCTNLDKELKYAKYERFTRHNYAAYKAKTATE